MKIYNVIEISNINTQKFGFEGNHCLNENPWKLIHFGNLKLKILTTNPKELYIFLTKLPTN